MYLNYQNSMEAERCQAMKVIFKLINVFEIGLYFSNPFIFFKSVYINFRSNYLFQIELYFSNQFIFFKSIYVLDLCKFFKLNYFFKSIYIFRICLYFLYPLIYLYFSNRFMYFESVEMI